MFTANQWSRLFAVVAIVIATWSSAAYGQEMMQSGFMSDYSQLRKVTDGTADYRYIAPGAEDKLAKYNAVMVDQPEFFIAADSPYRGVKPRQLDVLGEALRDGFATGLAKEFFVVERPGESVLYVRAALANLKLKRTKPGVADFLPVVLVTRPIRRAATTDIAKKADLRGMVLEMEVFDSVTGERLVAIIDSRGVDAGDVTSWDQIDQMARDYGEVMLCRMANSRYSEVARANCLELIRH